MSTITVPGWISLDSLDTFLSRHSGPWGLSSVHDYEEPALHSYSTIVPEATPQTSAAEVLLTILFYAGAFVLICAALMPTYLAFESQILKVLKPLDDFTRATCEGLDFALPMPILALDTPGLDTSTAEDVDDVFFDAPEGPPSSPLPAASPLPVTTTIPMSGFFVENALSHVRTISKHDRDEVLKQQKIQFDTLKEEMSKMLKVVSAPPPSPPSPPATAVQIQGILEDCRESTLVDCQSAIQEQQKAFKDELAQLIQDATAAPTPPALTTRDLDALAERIQKQTIESCTELFHGSLAGTKKDLLEEVKLANEEAHETCNTKAARLPISESREMRRFKEENSRLRKDVRAVTSERDEASSKFRAAVGKQHTDSLRHMEITRRVTGAQLEEHAKAVKSHVDMAIAVQHDHALDLAAKDALARQVGQQHQASLAAKDEHASRLDARHKQTIKNATSLYHKTKREMDAAEAEHASERQADATASERWKAEYLEVCAKAAEEKAKEVAKEVEEQQAQTAREHARQCQEIRDQNAAETERLVLDHERLRLYCDRLNEMATQRQ